MQNLRRRASAEAVARDAATVEALADRPAPVSSLARRLNDAVLVELLRPATAVDGEVLVPREHFDEVVDGLHDARSRIEALARVPIGLIDLRRSVLYRRGYRRVDGDGIGSADAARERLAAARRREMKLLTGSVTSSIALGTAAVLAGGVVSSPLLLGLGVALLVSMIPVAVGGFQYYRGVKDHLLEARHRHEAAALERELGSATVRILDRGEAVPAGAERRS